MLHPHGQNLRKGRISEEGRIYLITSVTEQRTPIFLDFNKARQLTLTLRGASLNGHAETLAFVIMHDHLHWLMQLGPQKDLSRVVGAIKSISARKIGGLRWQGGFHDRAVRKDEDLRALARYVILNPVRAGLTARVGDYPHWDAIWIGSP